MATYINLGADASGNGNNWTTNNINWTTVGVTYDVMTDVPTLTSATAANFSVMSPIDSASPIKPEYANLRLRNANSTHSITRGTIGVTSGKYYWEIVVSSAMSNFYSGIATNQTDIYTTTTVGADAYSWAYVGSNGEKRYNGSTASYGSALVNGDVLGCALDLDSGKIWWSVNGTFQASGNPAAGTNEAFSGVTGTCFPAGGAYNMTIDYNFGQRPFAYTPPTGFNRLNTFNLPTPTIGATATTQANKYMDATLYTGNGTSQSVVNAGGFQPDWVWIKMRSGAAGNELFDSARGANIVLFSNATNAESNSGTMSAFNSNGFTPVYQASDVSTNNNGSTYVGWQWRANGAGVSNTAGSITSSVSANTSAGFSVVTYTGTGANATVGHGLGVAPKMVIIKSRSAVDFWVVWQTALSGTEYLLLNSTNAKATAATYFNSTIPSSTVFSLGSDSRPNGNGTTYVAYCFAEVAGYSKFGSYTGNGSADGTFIYTGFKPAYVLRKRTDSTSDWVIADDARNPNNEVTYRLYANVSDSEGGEALDFLSNGFKNKADGSLNTNGGSYIYMAFAESPFKFANAR
jgi:hypothetical protein